MKRSRVLTYAVALIILGAIAYLLPHSACTVTTSHWTLRGSSLSGVLESGQEVTAHTGYYACHMPAHNEIVIYAMPGRAEPLMKIIKGVPGDQFNVRKTEEGNEIFINNEKLLTTTDRPYIISDNRLEYLSGYEKKYNGRVPEGYAFILGNVPGGSVDSILFGFVQIKDLVARVDWPTRH